MPSVGVSTPEAFARYDEVGSSVHPDSAAAEAAVKAGDLNALCAASGDALEECSGAKETPAIKRLLDDNGALASLMTGSGAAVFGVFHDEEAAKKAAAALRGQYSQVYLAQPDRWGARVVHSRRPGHTWNRGGKRRNKNPGRRNKKQNARPCYWQKLPGKGRAFYVFACT